MIDVYESVNQKLKKIKDKNVELIKDTSDFFFRIKIFQNDIS